MVSLAIITGSIAISPTKRKPANFAVKRCRLLLLVANDSLIPFPLKMQDQSPPSFGGSNSVNIYVVEIWKCFRISDEI